MNELKIVRPLILGMIISLVGLMVGSTNLRNVITINGLGLNNYLAIFYTIVFVGLFFGFNRGLVIKTINISQFKFASVALLVGGILIGLLSFWEVSQFIVFIGPYTVATLFLGLTEISHVAPVLMNFLTPVIVVPIVFGFFGFLTKYLYDLTSNSSPAIRIIISSLPFLLIFVLIPLFHFVSMLVGGRY